MTAFARHPDANTYAYGASENDDDYTPVELFPGERIGRPLARTQYRTAVRRSMVMLIVIAGGWAMLDERATWPAWLMAETSALYASLEARVKSLTEPTSPAASLTATSANAGMGPKLAALDQPLPPEPAPTVSKASTAPIAETKAAEQPATSAAVPPLAEAEAAPMSQPLPPPVVDASDPYQKKALAVGLHPDLSRVLLARLSAADYRNAGIAVQTALVETPDSAVYIWPRQRKPELAMFQVHFVPGAANDCRRYVVTVSKDGWLTTALPLEKCGVKPRPTDATARKAVAAQDVFRTEAGSR